MPTPPNVQGGMQTILHGSKGSGDTPWVPVSVDSTGKLNVNATVSVTGSTTALNDGADETIKATVKDYANSNPLTVIQVDTNGDPLSGGAVTIANGADVAEGATTD